MEKHALSEDERLKKELDRIERDFRISLAALIICATIIMIVLVKWFPFE